MTHEASEKVIRHTTTMCPECSVDIPGRVVAEDGSVFLDRNCPDHGPYRLLLSRHAESYADLDRFFFNVLKGRETHGRITRYWVFATPKCPVDCTYCNVEIRKPFFDAMTPEDYGRVLEEYSHVKLTLSGGEPTANPNMDSFFEQARDKGVWTELGTRGLKLANADYCNGLTKSGVKWVRVSIDSFDREQAAKVSNPAFFEPTLKALRNLESIGLTTTLAPTIFKGVNDDQLGAAVEYAHSRPFIRELSVNGFSWVGEGMHDDRERMIMPDEMMDLLHDRFFTTDRDDVYSFQKFLLVALKVAKIRLCLYTQLMIFVRDQDGPRPITDYLHMERMRRALRRVERLFLGGRFSQALGLATVGLAAFRLRTLSILGSLIRMYAINVLKIDTRKFPRRLVPVVLNTNCSPLSADTLVGAQCMAGVVYVRDGKIVEDLGTKILLGKAKGQPEYVRSPSAANTAGRPTDKTVSAQPGNA